MRDAKTMARLQRISLFLSACCAAGLLIVAIVTGNSGPADDERLTAAREPASAPESSEPARVRPAVTAVKTVTITPTDQQRGLTIDEIIAANPESEMIEKFPPARRGDRLAAVQTARTAQTVVVRTGDTLYGIARTNNVDVAVLARLNDIEAPNLIRQGQVLRLPPR